MVYVYVGSQFGDQIVLRRSGPGFRGDEVLKWGQSAKINPRKKH
jgi:hypothetical protein